MNCAKCGKELREYADEYGAHCIEAQNYGDGLVCLECGEKELLEMMARAAARIAEDEMANKNFKLKPCPFCGGEVEWRGYSIQCPCCSAFMAFGFTGNGWREATVNAYNSRFIRITEEK